MQHVIQVRKHVINRSILSGPKMILFRASDLLFMYQGGGVLIAEALLFENRRGPTTVQMFSLNMLVQTEGKEHPPSHYTRLLTDAGFRDVQVCRTGKSYDAILALK